MIRLQPAADEDEFTFWELRHREESWVTRDEHLAWWARVSEHRFLAFDGPALVGVLRISHDGVLSLIVKVKERNRGFGVQMLQAVQPVAKGLGFHRLKARVQPDNAPSQHAFLRAGYRPTRFEVAL